MAARNAAASVEPAIRNLVRADHEGPVDLLAVVNGSSDGTADAFRRLEPAILERGWALRVEELPNGGKPASLRHAAELAKPGPLVICDLRVRPRPPSLRLIVEPLLGGDLDLASGWLCYQLGPSSVVNAFVRSYRSAPYARGSDVQGTFVAVSPQRRSWVTEMPDVGADDRYLLLRAPRSRRRRVLAAAVDYHFPDSVVGLWRQQVRWHQTNRVVDALIDGGDRPGHEVERRPYFGGQRPSVVDVGVYAGVTLSAAAVARLRPAPRAVW